MSKINKVFQMQAEGDMAMFSGLNKIVSRIVYTTFPTDEQFEEFKQLCVGDGTGFGDLKLESIKTKVFELIIR